MYRYLAIIWSPLRPEATRISQSFSAALTSSPTEWRCAYEGPGVLVVHTGLREGSAEAYALKNNSGVILGNIFSRHRDDYTARRPVSFDESETRSVVTTGGQHIIDHYWGSYVAIVYDKQTGKHHVFREPTGNIPCYHTSYRGVDVFFSHIEDCVRFLPISFPINRHYLTCWLIFSRRMGRDCGLDNVEDVPGGRRLTIVQGHITRSQLWNPTEIASSARIEQPNEAARQLRLTVQRTIDAWASCYQNITHKLSGGLDSSIVAGCLARAPSNPRITYLNFAIDVGFDQERLHLPGIDKKTADKIRSISGHGDERYFARLIAERWGTPLIERQRVVSMDLTRMWQAPLMISPPMFFTAMEVDDAEIEFVKTYGSQAFFSGQAGDSVFLATTQPLPAIDYAYLHGIKSSLWQHVVATSTLSKYSVWTVLAKAIKHGILRRPYLSPASVLGQPTLLKKELTRLLSPEDFESLWSKSALSLPPGKQNHIKGLDGSAHYDYVFHSQRYADHVDPLNSQPIWEVMLQIPTYTILSGGVSRGLARRAFADLLPVEIRKRHVKGTGTPFYQQVVRRNRNLLRQTLLDGLLVQEGYLDRQALNACLAADEPFLTIRASQLLSYLAAEVWLQQWTGLRSKAAA